MEPDEEVEKLAKILHESGREAVAQGFVVYPQNKPFLEWDEISDEAREGRKMMARYILWHPDVGIVWRTSADA